ncbi:Inositol-pentakisphosphate 2-kinase [Diatrype stigma]|uniref:Inositol-pentakisphosphate 2-kinase n=1 Tax=Diatrype stigma TaxID=117547 RepID=A0AAN9YLX1_9PEZI
MESIWEKLSKPLPSSRDAEPEPVVTPALRESLTALLDRYEFEYLAEGRANVVFSIRDTAEADLGGTGTGAGTGAPAPPSPPPVGQFRGTLLRVPKTTPGVTPCDYATLQRFHEEAVERRVGREHVVPQILVSISQGLADRLDAGLRRDSTRSGGHDHDDDHEKETITATAAVIHPGPAMLVQDMGPSEAYPLALEFKPKWLAQSPLAPPGATRCRSCAREALRNAQKITAAASAAAGTPPPPPPVCRLGLIHDDPAIFRATVDEIVAPWAVAERWSEHDRARLAAGLRASGVLERIRDLQVSGDPAPGKALFEGPSDPDFGLAMTLRDCSCFVRMTATTAAAAAGDDHHDGAGVVVKLADVDKKNWHEKQTYWQTSHRNLVKGGWYEGKEDPPMETHCLLGQLGV